MRTSNERQEDKEAAEAASDTPPVTCRFRV